MGFPCKYGCGMNIEKDKETNLWVTEGTKIPHPKQCTKAPHKGDRTAKKNYYSNTLNGTQETKKPIITNQQLLDEINRCNDKLDDLKEATSDLIVSRELITAMMEKLKGLSFEKASGDKLE